MAHDHRAHQYPRHVHRLGHGLQVRLVTDQVPLRVPGEQVNLFLNILFCLVRLIRFNYSFF